MHLTNAQFDRASGVLLGAQVAATLAGEELVDHTVWEVARKALTYLDRPASMVDWEDRPDPGREAGRELAGARALLGAAIQDAVLHGSLDLRGGLSSLPQASRVAWTRAIDAAEAPGDLARQDGRAVEGSLLAAWSCIVRTPTPAGPFECGHLVDALEAVRALGGSAPPALTPELAGVLLGARWGASAFPAAVRMLLDGTRRHRASDLEDLAYVMVRGQNLGSTDWPLVDHVDYAASQLGDPTLRRHPFDRGVWLAAAPVLDSPPADVTAVVSLCPLGRAQVPDHVVHVRFRLLDNALPRNNPHLDFVIDDAARTVATLREMGHVVMLHCVAAHSRTPTIAIRYAQLLGVPADVAFDGVVAALPHAYPNPGFKAALRRLSSHTPGPGESADVTLSDALVAARRHA